ncbi:MAG: hypothetical protein R3E42_12585 [Burkholderiaceae bacterium]
MKALALALLALAAVVYATAVYLGPRHVAWGYGRGGRGHRHDRGPGRLVFARGGAVRHPLGLPIPHTAIIAAQKDRLGTQLARPQ